MSRHEVFSCVLRVETPGQSPPLLHDSMTLTSFGDSGSPAQEKALDKKFALEARGSAWDVGSFGCSRGWSRTILRLPCAGRRR